MPRASSTLCAEIFPDEEVPPRARLVLEDSFNGD
jgi:hypothetical protein